jgi:hypothetical protein
MTCARIVLRVDKARAENWSEVRAMERWEKLFNLPLLIRGYQKGQSGTEAESLKAREIVATWRERLLDISWFKRSLNEYRARQQRIAQLGEDMRRQNHTSMSVPLMPLVKQSEDPQRNAIGFTQHDYLELVD